MTWDCFTDNKWLTYKAGCRTALVCCKEDMASAQSSKVPKTWYPSFIIAVQIITIKLRVFSWQFKDPLLSQSKCSLLDCTDTFREYLVLCRSQSREHEGPPPSDPKTPWQNQCIAAVHWCITGVFSRWSTMTYNCFDEKINAKVLKQNL